MPVLLIFVHLVPNVFGMYFRSCPGIFLPCIGHRALCGAASGVEIDLLCYPVLPQRQIDRSCKLPGSVINHLSCIQSTPTPQM